MASQYRYMDVENSDTAALERSPSLMSRSSAGSRDSPPPETPQLSSSTSAFSGLHHGLNRSTTSHSVFNAFKNENVNGAAHHPPASEKGLFGYQAKMLSRTGSIQSLSSMHNSAIPPRITPSPTLQYVNRNAADDNGNSTTTSRAAKRTTWAAPSSLSQSHRTGATGSISSFDDIKGRFGGRVTPTSRPASPTKPSASTAGQSTPTWRQNLLSRSTYNSSSNINNNNNENIAPATSPTPPPFSARSYSTTSSSNTASTPSSAYTPHDTRPFSPPLPSSTYSSNSSNNAHLESEIMRSSFSAGHRPKQASLHLGAVKDLGTSSVSALRNLRDFAVHGGASATGDAGSGPERTFTVRGSNSHRRTRTLPDLGLATSESAARTPEDRPRAARLNMHGLDRLSERSDGSTGSAPSSPRHATRLGDELGHGRPEGTKSSHGRRMASDAGEEETGAIVIPGITVGSDSVAGMSGRLRLARQPTLPSAKSHVSKYGGKNTSFLPSQTIKAMDSQRQCLQAYEYLCHVSEAKEWLVQSLSDHPMSPQLSHSVTSPELPSAMMSPTIMSSPTKMSGGFGEGDEEDPSGLSNKSVVELEEALRNGVALARLARAFMGARAVPRIFTVSPQLSLPDNSYLLIQFVYYACRPLDRASAIQTTSTISSNSAQTSVFRKYSVSSSQISTTPRTSLK